MKNTHGGVILLVKLQASGLHKQISFFLAIFIKLVSAKSDSAQHCLLALLETPKSNVNQREEFGALMTDLSRFFD